MIDRTKPDFRDAGQPPSIGALRQAGPDRPAGPAEPTGPAATGLDLERYVPGFLTFLANKLANGAGTLYAREFGVNVTEWRVLSQLAIEPGITASRICQVIGFDKGPVSRTLAALEQRSLVASRPDGQDGRRRLLDLTRRGRALHDRILPVALKRERLLLACLSEREREFLIDALRRLHANLPAVADAGPGTTP